MRVMQGRSVRGPEMRTHDWVLEAVGEIRWDGLNAVSGGAMVKRVGFS